MAARNPLVLIAGIISELPTGHTVPQLAPANAAGGSAGTTLGGVANFDGGNAVNLYGGTTPLNCGGATG